MRLHRFTAVLLLLLLLMGVTALSAQETEEFPIIFEHKFGTTTLTEAPQRVVAIGYSEHDYLLALGITPVAVRYWYGDESDAVRPWARDLVEGDAPVVLNMPFGALNYEAILALEPDLISAVTAGITEEEYQALSQIAPTLANTDEYIDFGIPWQEVTRIIGRAVGKSDQAEAIIADVDTLFDAVVVENPEFAGKTVASSFYYDGVYGFYVPADTRGRFFTSLGFVIPDELIEIAGDSFYVNLSPERVDLLDQDLIAIVNLQFIEGGIEALEAEPLFGQLSAVQEGRVIYLDVEAEDALAYSTPLSLSYALEAVLPQLEAIFSPASEETDSACKSGFYFVQHHLGESCIPDDPQNVVVLGPAAAEFAYLAGLNIVGIPQHILDELLYVAPHLAADFEDVTIVGWPPNLEIILALEPDLILGHNVTQNTDSYTALQAIAPTVIQSLDVGFNWETAADFWAGVLNADDVVAELKSLYDERVATLSALLEADEREVSVLVASDPQFTFTRLPNSDLGRVFADVGINRPASQSEEMDRGILSISLETLYLADGDVLFLFGYPYVDAEAIAQQNAYLDDLVASPLWQTLNVVQNDQVFRVSDYWYRGGLYTHAIHQVLDDLFIYLADVDPAEVSPNPFNPESN